MRMVLCFLFVLAMRFDLHAEEELSLEDARTIFEAMQQKYRSLSCDHLRESNVAPERVVGQYFQAENGWIRGILKRTDAFDQDVIIKNNIHANYQRYLSTIEIKPLWTPTEFARGLILCDAWEMAGLRFYLGKDFHLRNASEYLADRTIPKECTQYANGDIVITSQIVDKKLIEKRTFSKQHNYMFKSRVLVESDTGTVALEELVQSYVQSNGLHFPKLITRTNYLPDKRLSGTPDIVVETITFSNVSINNTIPLSTFEDHVGTPGTTIIDTISQTTDIIESNGVRKRTDPASIDPARTNFPSTTSEQVVVTNIWIGVAVVAVGIVLGIGIFITMKRRNRVE